MVTFYFDDYGYLTFILSNRLFARPFYQLIPDNRI